MTDLPTLNLTDFHLEAEKAELPISVIHVLNGSYVLLIQGESKVAIKKEKLLKMISALQRAEYAMSNSREVFDGLVSDPVQGQSPGGETEANSP